MQRGTAVIAVFLWRIVYAQPASARGALRIQTLHGPPRKLVHVPSRRAKFGAVAENEETPCRYAPQKIKSP